MTDRRRVSFAQNAEDVRVWRAFRDADPTTLHYVDVGANEHRHLSITASLHDEGWRGVLIEADPVLAEELRVHRPDDLVIEVAAAGGGVLPPKMRLTTGNATVRRSMRRPPPPLNSCCSSRPSGRSCRCTCTAWTISMTSKSPSS